MMMMMMMNCFCGIVDRRKAFNLISSRDHCQRSSPSRISDTPWAGFEPAQNLSSGFGEWSCAVVITTTPRRKRFNFTEFAGEKSFVESSFNLVAANIIARHLLEDILKTSCKHLFKTSWKRFQKTYCKYILETSWRRLGKQKIFPGRQHHMCSHETIKIWLKVSSKFFLRKTRLSQF